VEASVRFLSVEPLLDDLGSIGLAGIHWIVVGGESGIKARPTREAWVGNVKEQADAANVAVFFKRWGAIGPDGIRRNKKANGCLF
jgi:protein gp37